MWFFGLLACLGAIAGAIIMVSGFASAQSAPQEAAVAAFAVALAVIPYVFFRAIQLISVASDTRAFQRQVLTQLREMSEPRSTPTSMPDASPCPSAQVVAQPIEPKVVQEGSMGAQDWSFKRFDNDTVEIVQPGGHTIHYPSLQAAQRELTWWRPDTP